MNQDETIFLYFCLIYKCNNTLAFYTNNKSKRPLELKLALLTVNKSFFF